MIHPDTELRKVSDEIGLGVFATRFIPRGTVVWALDELDHKLSDLRVRTLGRRYDALLNRYAYTNGHGELILCWDLARWMNHSCDANSLSLGWDFDIAVHDIQAGEEITNDYGCLNLQESFECACRRPECRRTVGADDFERMADFWDERVRGAFPQIRQVTQPLWPWVKPRRAIAAALRDPQRLPSVRRHRYQPPLESRARTLAGSG